MAFCTKCGTSVADDAAFCGGCGAPRNNASRNPTTSAAGRPITPRAQGATNCLNCGRSWGEGRHCQYCGQVEGLPAGVALASPGLRLGGYLLEGVLAIVTLGIGWLVWSLIVYSWGQTPAKQILGMRVVKITSGKTAHWGTMFLREFIAKPVIGVIAFATVIGLVVFFWLLWDKDSQELWDKIVGTIVVAKSDI